jgi:DNA-entry nuclease
MRRRTSKRTKTNIVTALLVALVLVGVRGTKWNNTKGSKSPHSYGVVRDVDQTSETKQSSADVSNVRSANSNAEFSLDDIPKYTSFPSVSVNSNEPYFTKEDIEKAKTSYESYGEHDSLGRCTTCIASIGKDLMPTGPRGEIGMIKPTGWHTVKYKNVEGNDCSNRSNGHYLYNRCHLIGYQLTGENANDKNLITGTRYMNVEGMEPYENNTASYVRQTGNHVLYRVTPVFSGNDLLAQGVLMEAESVEDNGAGLKFCVFCYNVQPGIEINYADGSSKGDIYE